MIAIYTILYVALLVILLRVTSGLFGYIIIKYADSIKRRDQAYRDYYNEEDYQ